MSQKLELVCPAGTPSALAAAVEAGADAVYFGFRDRTNARNFPGLNFSPAEAAQAAALCRDRGVRPMIAINTFAASGQEHIWRQAVDTAAGVGVGAIIVADIGVAAYAARTYPDLRLHLSVQAAAANPEAVAYYARLFNVQRVVLPRVFTVDDIRMVTASQPGVEVEVFVLGGLCVMAEGRCTLSSYATGRSPNRDGVCSPAEDVRYEQEGDVLVSRLAGYTINRFGPGEGAGYPTLCKGRFEARGRASYLFEDPVSLDATALLPDLAAAGVTAIKVEGRQRGKAYVAAVVGNLRRAIDLLADGGGANGGRAGAAVSAAGFTEGGRTTEGAYKRGWR